VTITRKVHVSALTGHGQVFFKTTCDPTIYIVRTRDGEISTSGLYCVIYNFYIGMRWCVLARGAIGSGG